MEEESNLNQLEKIIATKEEALSVIELEDPENINKVELQDVINELIQDRDTLKDQFELSKQGIILDNERIIELKIKLDVRTITWDEMQEYISITR